MQTLFPLMRIYLLLLIILGAGQLSAQNSSNTIEIEQKALGVVFKKNGDRLTPRQLVQLTQGDATVAKEMEQAKLNYDVGTVIGTIGGAFIGFPIGAALAGGEPNWALAGIGAGLVVVSIPFSVAFKKRSIKAVNMYNENQNGGEVTSRVQLSFGFSNAGLGMRVAF